MEPLLKDGLVNESSSGILSTKAPNEVHSEPVESPAVTKLRDLIKGISVAMLTTVAPSGAIYARPMMTQQLDVDGDLWFFTRLDTPKSTELIHEPNVNVAYVDPGSGKYISVAGTGYVMKHPEKAAELWTPAAQAWFPEGLEDPSLALIRVKIHSAEYWEYTSNFVTRMLEFAKSAMTGETPDIGENKILKMN